MISKEVQTKPGVSTPKMAEDTPSVPTQESSSTSAAKMSEDTSSMQSTHLNNSAQNLDEDNSLSITSNTSSPTFEDAVDTTSLDTSTLAILEDTGDTTSTLTILKDTIDTLEDAVNSFQSINTSLSKVTGNTLPESTTPDSIPSDTSASKTEDTLPMSSSTIVPEATQAPPATSRARRSHFDFVHTKTFTPREYQVELLDSSYKRNVIACMGTGAGKTFIAVMLIRELSHQLRGSYDEDAKRTIFLCPTVVLARQQRSVLEDHTDLAVREYAGSLGLEFWLQDEWLEEFRKYQVLVMTPDIFKGVLFSGFMPLSKVNLLILDECHHAVKNHPYREIMRCFNTCPADKRPKILGLSASLLNSNCKPEELEQKIRNLERSLRSRVETSGDLSSIYLHITKPREDICTFLPFLCDKEYFLSAQEHLENALDFLTDVVPDWDPADELPNPVIQPKRYLVEASHLLLTLGPWCGLRAARVFMKEISRLVEIAYSPSHIQLLMLVRTVLEVVCCLCELYMEGHDSKSRLLNLAPNKLKCLLEILREFKPEEVQTPAPIEDTPTTKPVERRKLFTESKEPKSLCGIIFVKQRVTAFVLNIWLQEVSRTEPEFSFLSPNFVVGHSVSNRAHGLAMNTQNQEDTLRKFRMREHNLIIATSVVEEGMDVPRCNLVVRFDLPSDFRAYIQSKGRARAPGSIFVLMVPGDQQQKAVEQLVNYHTIEKILGRQCGEQNCPTDEEVDEELADQLIEPFMPVKEDGAARVSMSSAIALVNRYCGKLPSDTFTRLTPKWNIISIEDNQPLYQCCITLPINSPLKEEVKGIPMKSKKLSQMATALETCKKLHQIGELDDNLLPVGKESVRFQEDPNLLNEEVPPGAPRPGTTKRRQYYYKMVAEVLQGSGPVCGVPCCLYRFSMNLTCPIPQEQNTRGRKIHDPASTTRGFGILTTRPIPPVCCFPVFTRSGEVTISLESVFTEVVYSKEQLKQLLDFHRYSFADVLRLEKYPMLFQPDDTDNAFYVVPINKGNSPDTWDVDWEFVCEISKQSKKPSKKISEEERKSYVFRTQDYTDAVVMPWYRNLDKPQFFYVAEICSDLSPKSNFPDVGHKTFEGYYQEKYNINIMNLDQPLLDVDHTSARLNLLTPRYVNRKGMTLPTSSEQTKKAKRENLQQKQILVPELCIVHPFPASLWRKAVCLPCILYRINSLLLAEQLRVTVSREIGVGTVELKNGFTWPALDFGWTLAEVLEKAAQQTVNEEKSKPVLIIPEPQKTERLKTIPNVWQNESKVSTKNDDDDDFVIDTFDPSKVHIPDDDFLLDQEVAQLTFAGGPIWTAPTPDTDDVVRIRYGSPSRFEGTGWDSEWDTDDTNMFQINLPGLGYISAPSGFNIQGLSHDLASCRDDDIWDSDFDDDDSIYDEMEGPPESPIPASLPDVDAKTKNEDASARIPIKTAKITPKESLFSEWLSQCSSCFSETESASTNLKPPLEGRIDKTVRQDVSLLLEKARQNIDLKGAIIEPSSQGNIVLKYPKLNEAVNCLEQNCPSEVPIETEKPCDDLVEEELVLDGDVPLTPPPADFQATPTFGELLPGRDNLVSDDFAIFRVHFDEQPILPLHEGPSPSIILQALTMSNANDGINLERLETVGDSFLKYAITAYLYCSYPDIHEGKLSYLRSKQISNLHLYRLGKRCGLGKLMIASKFEPNDNWLPPCYTVPKGLEQAFIDSGMPAGHWNIGNLRDLRGLSEEEIRKVILEEKKSMSVKKPFISGPELFDTLPNLDEDGTPYIRYNLLTQQSIPDKSIADCVESLIGAYLISCGPRGALLFMSWLGLRVLPDLKPDSDDLKHRYGDLLPPKSPLLEYIPDPVGKLNLLLTGYNEFEEKISYKFRDRSYLLQAFTHASYHYNRLTDCYQRLEFLGDAVLDYLITRHLYEDPQQHYPGVLTDLRSALVNNTFFASLAVKYEFHKYFKAVSPGLFAVIGKFVDIKKKNPDFIHLEEYYLEEDECEEAEEVEVPKALGDIFESVAGAIYLDSGMSLDTVWRVYFAMMKPEIEYFSTHVPKSPIRELLETYPQTARFDRAEMTLSGKVRVRVEVVGQGQFVGLGRNKRIAKCTAAKRALRALKKMQRST